MTIIVPAPKFDPLYRAELLGIIQAEADGFERNAQELIGPSGVGGCERKVAFQLAYGASQDGPTGWSSLKGTILHEWLAKTYDKCDRTMPDGSPRFITETKLESSAEGIIAGGTCDLYDRLHHRVVDWKCPGAFTVDKFRAGQWSESYYIQCQIYGLHFSLAGHPVSTVGLAVLPMAGSELHSERTGAIFAYWDYDPSVAEEAIGNLRRITTMLKIADHPSKVINAMETRSDFCSNCPAFVGSNDRRGTCPGADIRVPQRDPNNPFG